jgi:MraZ protein
VARRFTGTSTHAVDGKGRVSIPASFRRVLEACDPDWITGAPARVHIVLGDRRTPYIEGYTMEAIAEIDSQIKRIPRGDPNRVRAQDYYFANAVELTVDDSGRLVLPRELRERAGVDTRAVFKSAGDTFKIMAPEAATPADDRMQDWLEEQGDGFDIATILPPLPVAT